MASWLSDGTGPLEADIWRLLKVLLCAFGSRSGRNHITGIVEFQVPSHRPKLKAKIERLVSYGVLQKVNRSEWVSPMFTVAKKEQTLRYIADLREVNKRIRRKPYPIPRIKELLHNLKGFQHETSLNLNMGY
jgi:hypothetical protein